jgi:hypothetical protein
MTTIGVDYKDKDELIDGQPMKIQIWVCFKTSLSNSNKTLDAGHSWPRAFQESHCKLLQESTRNCVDV